MLSKARQKIWSLKTWSLGGGGPPGPLGPHIVLRFWDIFFLYHRNVRNVLCRRFCLWTNLQETGPSTLILITQLLRKKLFASVPAAKTINWRKKRPWQRLITSFANSWQFSMVTISVVVSVTYFLLLLLGCEFHGFFYPWPPENTEKCATFKKEYESVLFISLHQILLLLLSPPANN